MTYATPSFESKICPPEQLTATAAKLARPLVFTNGCFDILHRGHVSYLAQAARPWRQPRRRRSIADASVKRLGKGDDRPVNALGRSHGCPGGTGERVAGYVAFDEDTPLDSSSG
jgi:bifunctional ADP-heptose synthase (sugar kinase/adenylyltransferase)